MKKHTKISSIQTRRFERLWWQVHRSTGKSTDGNGTFVRSIGGRVFAGKTIVRLERNGGPKTVEVFFHLGRTTNIGVSRRKTPVKKNYFFCRQPLKKIIYFVDTPKKKKLIFLSTPQKKKK